MKLDLQKKENLKRIRSISKEMNFNNKFQKVTFKISSRNQDSLLSSKSPKLRNKSSKKVIVASTKMITRYRKKAQHSVKLGEKYHSVDSGIKVKNKYLIFSKIFFSRIYVLSLLGILTLV